MIRRDPTYGLIYLAHYPWTPEGEPYGSPQGAMLYLGQAYVDRALDLITSAVSVIGPGIGSLPSEYQHLANHLALRPRATARAQYIFDMAMAMQDALADHDPEWYARLEAEDRLWRLADRGWLQDRVYRYLDPRLEPNAHWQWTGRLDSKHKPAINWGSDHDVSIVRLLWPLEYPKQPPGQHKLVRRRGICRAQDYPMCVNPYHYQVSEAKDMVLVVDAPKLMPGEPSGRYTETVHWRSDHYREASDGSRIVLCPRCDEPLPEVVQFRVNQLFMHNGKARCRSCAIRAKGNRVYKRRDDPLAYVPQPSPRLKLKLEREAWQAVGLRNGQGGPQVLPPDDEEPYTPPVLTPWELDALRVDQNEI